MTGDALGVTWLGHSTAVLERGGVRVVTDPLLGRHAGVLRRRGPRPQQVWQGASAAVLSHLHHDHAELASLRLLGDIPVLTAPENARWLRARGIPGAVGLEPHEWFDVSPDLSVRLTPALHGHRPMPHRPNAANGHVVRFAGGSDGAAVPMTVWAVGDTELTPDLRTVPELAGGPLDVVLVPVSGWGPRLSGGHMGPLQAAQLCEQVGARIAVPVHWGTLHAPGGRFLPPGWMDRPGEHFAQEVRRLAPSTRAVVLAPGETLEV